MAHPLGHPFTTDWRNGRRSWEGSPGRRLHPHKYSGFPVGYALRELKGPGQQTIIDGAAATLPILLGVIDGQAE